MSAPQRKKRNQKTASSSNAAAALERSGFLSFREVVSGGTNIFEAETTAGVTRELDQDLMLALRKMSKKDAHTREKALRELLCSMKEKDRDMVELCYTHFVTEANKLIMDGSPTVRMLSLRLISFFISSLRKAAEKHLKNVMPMVLIATRDTSTSVSGQAEALLTENFPGEKTNQVTQIFAVDTIRLAIEIIAGRHPLVKQQKYDCEDSEADRNSRLTIQCLLAIARLVDFVSSNDELKSALEIFLKETTQIKSLVKGNPSAKSALLGICIKVKNCMPILLESPLVNWIISNLDAQDPDVSARAFEALILFLSDERFYSKFDVHKSVVPKLLSVVRKKGIHWRAVSQFLLPSFALLASNVSDASNFIRSFLESFNDHLPFEAGDLTLCWVKSLSECVKFAFSNVQILPCLSDVDIINLLVQAVDMLLSEHTDCQECIASLLLWLFEKDVLPVQSRTFLLDSLQITLMNKRPLSDIMCGLLVASSSWVLRAFHVALLRVPPIQSTIIDPLLTCDDDYFMYVDKNVNIISVISKEPPSLNYARLVLRVLRKDPNRVKEIKLSSTFGPWIFSVFSPDDWPMLSSNLGTELLPCLKKIVIMWEKEKNYSAVTRTLKMIDIEQRGEVLSAVLEQPHGIEFVSNLLESLELPDNLTAEISRISFDSLFRNATDNTVDSTLRTLAQFPPCDALIRSALACYLSETAGQFSLDDLQRVGMVCSQLLFADSRYLALLPTQPELFSMLNSFDFYLADDVFARCGLLSDSSNACTRLSSEQELLRSVEEVARSALIYVNIDCEEEHHDVSLAYAAAVSTIIEMLYETRWKCEARSDILSDCLDQCRRVFQKTALASYRAIAALLALPAAPAIAQMTLRRLRLSTRPHLPLSSWNEPEKKLQWFWALQEDCSNLTLAPLDHLISRFHSDSRIEFLSSLYEYAQSDLCNFDDCIFSASTLNGPSWNICALCLVASVGIVEEDIAVIDAKILDFILCGVVTVADSCDEAMSSVHGDKPRIELLAGLAAMAFSKFDDLNRKLHGIPFDEEWPNFFRPAIARIIVRWYTLLRTESSPSFFTRCLVSALRLVKELPEDLVLETKLCPELDQFGYCGAHQTLILHSEALISSENIFVRFSALHMLRILSPAMYQQENGQWVEEQGIEGPSVSARPRQLVVPEVLGRIVDGTTGWSSIMAFDAVLTPLSTCISSDEERVAYCSALFHPVSTVLPQLFARCPEEIRKSEQYDFFTSADIDFGVDVLVRYAANLLFRTLASVPAVARSWYAGLPTTGMQIVNRYVRRYVSKLLVDAELQKVKIANQGQMKGDKLLKIRVVPVSGEVVAEYTVEETTIRLSIVMPVDWPLSVPSIQIDKAIVPTEKVKKWQLQLTKYLFHQNGSTVEGIMMWRRNVDRDVEGAEACSICMMTIHMTNHQLPKVKCRQCKNKFHSNCLYKWFETSSQSTCPLCRSNFC